MNRVRISQEHVPLVRRALAASDEPELREVGQHGAIDHLSDDKITQGT